MSTATSPPSGSSLSCVALPRLLPLFLGVSCGASISLAIALAGVRSTTLVKWLLQVPGEFLLQTLVGITLPLVALHATLTGSQLQTRQLPIQWLRLALATLAVSVLVTLLASVMGALVAAALHNVLPRSAVLARVWGLSPSSAAVEFRCPGDVHTGSVALQSNGTLACSVNATTFIIDDVAQTFMADAMTQKALGVSKQVVKMVESIFPESLASAFVEGDVLSLMVGGLALGSALMRSFLSEKRQEDEQNDGCLLEEESELEEKLMILQLFEQAEAAGCRVLSWLQTHLPVSVIFMFSSVLLQPSVSLSSDENDEGFTALALMTVLLLALVLDVVVMISLATLFTLSNPFAFLEHLLPAQLLALSSGSSLVALPATISAVVASKRVSPPVAFIVCCMSTVLNQTGTALYLSISTLFVLSASASGMTEDEQTVTRSTRTICVMVLVNVISASVVSPLPGGDNTAALATALGAVFGVPTGSGAVLLSYLAAMEWITAPFVTCVNITNNALIALVIAHYCEARPVTKTSTSSDDNTDAAMHQLLASDQ
uniref:Amino acid transporter n=1 Tax=Hyaloperonospora arabidopsidis (strain Emoy2) TaxID=559515 RepID=M4BYM4_HYAAE